jgi:hypothetical protein
MAIPGDNSRRGCMTVHTDNMVLEYQDIYREPSARKTKAASPQHSPPLLLSRLVAKPHEGFTEFVPFLPIRATTPE